MKKIISLFLSLIFLFISLSGCGRTPEQDISDESATESFSHSDEIEPESSLDVWDGSIATSFAGGDGTKSNPYQIATPQQFAYLAQQVNLGISYSGNHFALCNDIDLNDIEWTPIGTGIHAFMGNFEGNGHTIENLKISQSIHYTYEYPTGRKAAYCDSGLFATVQDASIQNMIIDGATIKIADTKSGDTHRVGVLCGTVRTYQRSSTISNIDIKNATITTDFSTNQSPMSLSIGGAIGHIYAYNNTTTTISLIETDSILSLTASLTSRNYMGTVLGGVNIKDATFTLENCAAYQTLMPNPYQYYSGASEDFCGAIGNTQASAQPFTIKNVFSKLTVNKPILEGNKYFDSEIIAHAIIGEAYYSSLKDDQNVVGYNFENVFGCIEYLDTKTGEKNISTELYNLPLGPDFTQINCQGCQSLPENHGFDTTVWSLDDLSKPKLK